MQQHKTRKKEFQIHKNIDIDRGKNTSYGNIEYNEQTK